MSGPHPQKDIRDRILRALRREGGRASGQLLGRATGRGHRINSVLRSMAQAGQLRRTGEKEGRSPIWEVVE